MTLTPLYPSGYGTTYLSLPDLIRRHGTQAEPETLLRLIAFLRSRHDYALSTTIGIGSGQRPCPADTSPASLICHSFHQAQRFSDDTYWFAAFDLVRANPKGPLYPHLSLRAGDLPAQGDPDTRLPPRGFGLHANVGTPGTAGFEPWHCQPSEIDGFDLWTATGRKRPLPILLNTTDSTPPPQPPTDNDYDLRTMTPLSTYHPLVIPQRFFDTRGFGGSSIPAGEYHPLPPYPATFNGRPLLAPAPETTPITGVKVGVKIVTPQATGFATVYTDPGMTPDTSVLDFPGPPTAGDPPAYNAILDVPVTADGHFQVYQNVPAHIVCDLYGYWT